MESWGMNRSVLTTIAHLANQYEDKTAVRDRFRSISYSDLIQESKSLAKAILAGLPSGRQGHIGIMCAQTIQAVVAQLGIAWSGNIWIFLDPENPVERNRAIVRDANIECIVADSEYVSMADALLKDGSTLIDLSRLVITDTCVERRMGDVAYVLYTSGTTGRPKGVVQSHENLFQHITTYINSIGLVPGDAVSVIPRLGVDASLMDVFGGLCSGACVNLYDLKVEGVDGLRSWIDNLGITIYHSTPTVFRALTAVLSPDDVFETVRCVVLGGETAYRSDMTAFAEHFPSKACLLNGLGPSESTLALQAFIDRNDIIEDGPLPVGRSVPGVRVKIVNETSSEESDFGELVLESKALALGYLNHPEKTDEVFKVTGEGREQRRYYTGDLVRRTRDGQLIFCGRKDRQLSVRGNRVEAGEIESAMRKLAPLTYVAALSMRLSETDVLVAAIVPDTREKLDISVFKTALRSILPPYMVPNEVFLLESFPLTSSGKVDLSRLRARLGTIAVKVRDIVPSDLFDSVRSEVVDLWAGTLKVAQLDASSDFFSLGGHSLMAIDIVTKVNAIYNVYLPLNSIFYHPTLGEFSRRLDDELSEHRQEAWSQVEKQSLSEFPAGGQAPLSKAQESFWFYHKLLPTNTAYHIAHYLEVDGKLDLSSLKCAFERLGKRHSILRTAFDVREGKAVQLIRDDFCYDYEFVDFEGRSAEEVDRLCDEYAKDKIQQPFELGKGKVCRYVVMFLGGGLHRLLFIIHHIAADGWSVRQLLEEWTQLYESELLGKGCPLDNQEVLHYGAYANQELSGASSHKLEEYKQWWLNRLDTVEQLDIPAVKKLPSLPSLKGAVYRFQLSRQLTDAIKTFCGEHQLTPYICSLAALSIVLARYSNKKDVSIATPVANRYSESVAKVVGPFVNTLLMHTKVPEDLSVRLYLYQVRKATLEAFERQSVAFADIVAAKRHDRDLSRHSVFQVMLAMQNISPAYFSTLTNTSRNLPIHNGASICDLSLTISEGSGLFDCEVEYSLDRYNEETAKKFASHFESTLAALIGNVDALVGSVDILSEAERTELVLQVNRTDRPYDFETPIWVQIEKQARDYPDRVALASDDKVLSYLELQGAAEHLAASLRDKKIGSGDLVPVLSGRGVETVIAFLGILATGAGFVPFDHRWPADRLEKFLKKIESDVLVVGAREGLDVENVGKYTCIHIENCIQKPGPSLQSEDIGIDDEQPLYGIYTSGSTGEPKLVLGRHRGITNRFQWMTEVYAQREVPVTLQTTPNCYDSAIWQLLWPLTLGGKVVIPKEDQLLNGQEIVRLVEDHDVSIIDFVPSVFDAIAPQLTKLSSNNAVSMRSLRHLILGGEELHHRSLDIFMRQYPYVSVTNLYGPTEASIGCIAQTVEDLSQPVPIGKPIANAKALILDDKKRVVPYGVAGEIYLAGDCLGLGYYQNSKAQNKAFVQNPFYGEMKDKRIYKTGDIARRRIDGAIEYIGRVDRQIKLRGVRIEPLEIESVICDYPKVKKAVVDVRSLREGYPQLVAWVDTSVDIESLRDHCVARLPHAMVPSYFVAHDDFKTLPGGKLDRQSLPNPELAETTGKNSRNRIPPIMHTSVEQGVKDIWEDVLQTNIESLDSNFFDLGGNSILSAVMHNRLVEELNADVSLVDIFTWPTIRSISERISKGV